jgi:hypothetical protein
MLQVSYEYDIPVQCIQCVELHWLNLGKIDNNFDPTVIFGQNICYRNISLNSLGICLPGHMEACITILVDYNVVQTYTVVNKFYLLKLDF